MLAIPRQTARKTEHFWETGARNIENFAPTTVLICNAAGMLLLRVAHTLVRHRGCCGCHPRLLLPTLRLQKHGRRRRGASPTAPRQPRGVRWRRTLLKQSRAIFRAGRF